MFGKGGNRKSNSPEPQANVELAQKVEQLSEALVFTDFTDPMALAELHTQFEELTQEAKKTENAAVAEVVEAATGLIEKIILEEASDPQATFDVVGKAISAIQAIACEGRDPSEVEIPEELGLSGGEGEAAAGLGRFKPPAHIDEAILSDFLSRQVGVLEELEELVLALEKPGGERALGQMRRLIHTMKGESAMLGMGEVERLCHGTEDLLTQVAPADAVDNLLEAKDWLGRAFESYAGEGPPHEPVDNLLESFVTRARAETAVPAEAPPEAVAEAEPEEEFIQLEADPELLGDFIGESNDHLEAVDLHLLTLETDPQSEDPLNAVFRAFHTIKGVSGFLALDDIGALAHEAESLLDRARRGDLVLEGVAIDVTFDATDCLKRMVGRVAESLHSGEPMGREMDLPRLLGRIKAAAAGGAGEAAQVWVDSDAAAGKKLGEILVESGAATQAGVDEALEKQSGPQEAKKLGEIIVGSAVTSRKKVEEALEVQEAGEGDRKLGEILVAAGAAALEEVEESLEQQPSSEPPKLGETLVRSGEASARDVAKALRSQKAAGRQAVRVKETLKVDADRLDLLVETIGELVIAESMVSQSPELRDLDSQQLERNISQLNKITRELQEMGMGLRMVPVRSTFQKMARLVRDLAKKSNKRVEYLMSGEDTELDKTVVENRRPAGAHGAQRRGPRPRGQPGGSPRGRQVGGGARRAARLPQGRQHLYRD